MTEESGFGTSEFSTPSSPSIPPSSSITHAVYLYDNGDYFYTTLSNIDPLATSGAQCSNNPHFLPQDWSFAPNNALTLSHLSSISKPWGDASLILSDGSRVSPSGLLLDGFGEPANHLIQKSVDGGIAYHANCTNSKNNLILLVLSRNLRSGLSLVDTVPSGVPLEPNEIKPTEPATHSRNQKSSYSSFLSFALLFSSLFASLL